MALCSFCPFENSDSFTYTLNFISMQAELFMYTSFLLKTIYGIKQKTEPRKKGSVSDYPHRYRLILPKGHDHWQTRSHSIG